jgi:hypothetical protein
LSDFFPSHFSMAIIAIERKSFTDCSICEQSKHHALQRMNYALVHTQPNVMEHKTCSIIAIKLGKGIKSGCSRRQRRAKVRGGKQATEE